MAKPFKIFLWIVGALVALIAVAAVALPLLVDPDRYKGRIVTAVHDSTGRELQINGDMKLTIFPVLGLSVADVMLGNAPGFGPEPFAQVGAMKVGVRVAPLLFERRLEIGTIHIDGFAVNLAKGADGTTNWSDLAQPKTKAETEKEVREETGQPLAFTVGGLDISNAALRYADRSTGADYKVDQLAVKTGAVELGKPLDVTIEFLANSAQPPLESQVKIAFTAVADLDTKRYELRDLKVDSTTKGESVPGGSQKASLRGRAQYDGTQGTFAFEDGVLEAAGLTVNAAIQGSGLATDAPKLAGKLSSNTFSPKDVAKSFGITLPATADPTALTQASFAADYRGTFSSAQLDAIKLKLDQTTVAGNLAIKDFATKAISFNLQGDRLDADRYLAPATAGEAKPAPKQKSGDFKSTEIPVDAIDALNISGTLQLAALKLKGVDLTQIRIVVNAPKGQPKTQEMSGLLYGGRITQSVRVTRNSPVRYDLKLGLDAVNSAPLLKDLLGKSPLSGLGNLKLDVASTGATVGAILQALDGNVATSFKNGAVEGFNLDETLARAKALYAGQEAPPSNTPKRTEFRDLKAAGKIVDGVLDTDTLDVKGSWYQLGGDGKVNLVEQTVDYVLYPTVSGDRFKELAGTRIPVRVSGSWYAPSVKVDLKSVVKGRVQQEVQKQEEKLKEKARDKIGDFLRRKAPPPAEKPAEPPKGETAPAQPAPSEPSAPAPSETPPAE